MGRPATQSGDVVAVNIDGRGAAWCDGIYSGDHDVIAHAKESAEIGTPVPYGFGWIASASDTPVGALASLMSYSPGRALITQAPPSVLNALSVHRELAPGTNRDEG